MVRLWDAVIVGGGPAGLSAALVLARARRSVVVVDSGHPRNAASRGVHGFLTRDGVTPGELRRLGRREARRYGAVLLAGVAAAAQRSGDAFLVRLAAGGVLRGRALVLATGVRDRLPAVPGLRALYGRSVHHCPYCDGWEERGRRLAAWGRGRPGFELARKLLGWSDDVILLSDGPARLGADGPRLAALGIPLHEQPIARLEGRGGRLRTVRFADGSALERDALFFSNGFEQGSPLARDLGCAFSRAGLVRTGRGERAGVPGLHVIGDASHDSQFVAVAVAEGLKAAVKIHQELAARDLRRPRGARRR